MGFLIYMGFLILIIILAVVIPILKYIEYHNYLNDFKSILDNDDYNEWENNYLEVKKSTHHGKLLANFDYIESNPFDEDWPKKKKFTEIYWVYKSLLLNNNELIIFDNYDLDDEICKFAIIQNHLYSNNQENNEKIINYYKPKRYQLSDIKYFRLDGDINTLSNISGGGGGGTSIPGAIVGGVIAGPIGAVIGSRKEVDDIETTYNIVDSRKTLIVFKDNYKIEIPHCITDLNDEIKYYDVYNNLLEIIPEKEFKYYVEEVRNKNLGNNINNKIE